ncbi:MAG: HAMP domain-containing histidine kinase [Ignavibacteriales bacterium]|nr:HAMP domain-containing histidine kinase [Ignavibacteriales bacterium]MCB9259890.1 HAMP domain-containing histidine kinase [Ignavibacteriales bacterium]
MDINSKDNNKSEYSSSEKTIEELLILEEARKLKTVFLDNMSHELRTPITVILGYAGILYEEIQDPELKEMAEIVLKSSNRLTESLNLLLDQSDVDSNRLKVAFEKKDLKLLLTEIYNIYKPIAEDKNLEIFFNTELNQANSNIDVKMFNKVITNLLNNAVKFTEKGRIGLELFSDNSNGTNFYCIKISDTGIGIPEEKRKLIFEAFRQVSEGMNRIYQGTGLGLSVSKKFVELMNGDITVESEVNIGSKFTLKFPSIL